MPTTTTRTTTRARRALTTHEPELTAPVLLCDERGRLNPDAVGWSRRPLHTCNVTGHAPRKKKWNYWAVHTDKFLFSVTIADVDHYVLAFCYFLEFATKRFVERAAILPPGGLVLPETVRASTVFEQGGVRVALEDERRGTRISVRWPDFLDGELVADLLVEQPRDHETLNVVIPWSRDRFQFTSKQNTLRASGTIALGDETHPRRSAMRRSPRTTSGAASGRTARRGTGARHRASCRTDARSASTSAAPGPTAPA